MSNTTLFTEGERVTLEEMLDVREKRVAIQRELLSSQKEDSLLMALMNIPGPIKNNQQLEAVFAEVLERIEEVLGNDLPQASLYRNLKTGTEYFILSPLTPAQLKEKMVTIEETHPFGRLFDLDVLWMEGNDLKCLIKSSLAGLMAIPNSVTTTSTLEPGVTTVLTVSTIVGIRLRISGEMTKLILQAALVSE